MDSRRIGIVGAGAIGGWAGVRLALCGHRVSVLARGATLAALQDRPWRLNMAGEQLEARIHAADNGAALGEQDIVLITLKGPALASAVSDIAAMTGPESVIVPMMNGVPWWFLLAGGGELGPSALASIDPSGEIARHLPFDRVVGNVVHAAASGTGPGQVTHKAGNRLIFGEPGGGTSARVTALCNLFRDAGFEAEASERIRYEIWYKLWGNMTMNPISAITGATCDRLLDDPLVSGFALRVMEEARAIGARIGCPIEERGEDRNAVTRKLGAFKTSMLQDAESGKPLEIDQLLSAPREIARLLGMETPAIDALTGMTRLFAREKGLYST